MCSEVPPSPQLSSTVEVFQSLASIPVLFIRRRTGKEGKAVGSSGPFSHPSLYLPQVTELVVLVTLFLALRILGTWQGTFSCLLWPLTSFVNEKKKAEEMCITPTQKCKELT